MNEQISNRILTIILINLLLLLFCYCNSLKRYVILFVKTINY